MKIFDPVYEWVEWVGGGSVLLLAMELVKTIQFDPSQSLRVKFKVLGGQQRVFWEDLARHQTWAHTRKSLV